MFRTELFFIFCTLTVNSVLRDFCSLSPNPAVCLSCCLFCCVPLMLPVLCHDPHVLHLYLTGEESRVLTPLYRSWHLYLYVMIV